MPFFHLQRLWTVPSLGKARTNAEIYSLWEFFLNNGSKVLRDAFKLGSALLG